MSSNLHFIKIPTGIEVVPRDAVEDLILRQHEVKELLDSGGIWSFYAEDNNDEPV